MRIVLSSDDAVTRRVLEIQRAAYAVEADLVGNDAIPPLHETFAELQAQPLVFLGVSCDRTLAGVLGYRRDGDTVDIDRVAIDPAFFRRGLATKLLRELLARERDATRFTVSTGFGNRPAISLYERFGFASSAWPNRHQGPRSCTSSAASRNSARPRVHPGGVVVVDPGDGVERPVGRVGCHLRVALALGAPSGRWNRVVLAVDSACSRDARGRRTARSGAARRARPSRPGGRRSGSPRPRSPGRRPGP